jgi:hypothetical protein
MKVSRELFNITNENLMNKEISHCSCHIRMHHALSSVKSFFLGEGEAWDLTLLGSLGLG